MNATHHAGTRNAVFISFSTSNNAGLSSMHAAYGKAEGRCGSCPLFSRSERCFTDGRCEEGGDGWRAHFKSCGRNQ